MPISLTYRPSSFPLAHQGPLTTVPAASEGKFLSYASTFSYAPPIPAWVRDEVPAARRGLLIAPGSLRRYEFTEREGDPAVGTVVYLRTIHGSDFDKDAHVVVNTGMYLLEVLKELRRQYNAGVRSFFEEGCSVNRVLTAEERGIVRGVFPFIPEAPTREQLSLLYKMPVSWTFSGLFPDARNRRVMTPLEAEDENKMRLKYNALVRTKGLKAANIGMAEYVVTRRDGRTVRELKEFFAENPGETATVVFGSGHRPAEAFDLMECRARLVSVWWDHPLIDHKATLPANIRKRFGKV